MSASTTQNIGYPSIMTPLKMGKAKNLIFYSLIQLLQFNFYFADESRVFRIMLKKIV